MNTIEIIRRKSNLGTLYVEAEIGCDIHSVCVEAIQLAVRNKMKVEFQFNGVDIIVTENDTPDDVVAEFLNELDRRANIWKESEAGKQYAKEQAQKLDILQHAVDEMLYVFDEISTDTGKLIAWVGRVAELNDHIGLKFDKLELAKKMEALGYVENEEVGTRSVDIQQSKLRMARYIIGQAINNLKSGMPIHPMCSKFATDYANS